MSRLLLAAAAVPAAGVYGIPTLFLYINYEELPERAPPSKLDLLKELVRMEEATSRAG
jgi:hypothetical protein